MSDSVSGKPAACGGAGPYSDHCDGCRALAAVIALHQPDERGQCVGCLSGCWDPHDCQHNWPCPTYKAATEYEPPGPPE